MIQPLPIPATPKERPIIFTGDSVRAILAGAKTQTRRVIKPQPKHAPWTGYMCVPLEGCVIECGPDYPDNQDDIVRCPYRVPGDRLWVRETWGWSAKLPVSKFYDECTRIGYPDMFAYRADTPTGNWSWRSPIHMPRWASRITLELIEVRMQRLQEITEEDAWSEGLSMMDYHRPLEGFSELWNRINAKRGYGWDTNCWVWCLTFRRIDP